MKTLGIGKDHTYKETKSSISVIGNKLFKLEQELQFG